MRWLPPIDSPQDGAFGVSTHPIEVPQTPHKRLRLQLITLDGKF